MHFLLVSLFFNDFETDMRVYFFSLSILFGCLFTCVEVKIV